MIAPAVRPPAQSRSKMWISAIVSSTEAAASAASRNSRSRLTCRGRSAATTASARAPARPARTSASTRARDTEFRAASAAAKTPASGIRRTAMTISGRVPFMAWALLAVLEASGAEHGGVAAPPGRLGGGILPRGAPVGEQLALQPEHLPLLLRLGVVVAEQVQHAVHGEQVQLVAEGVACLASLRLCEVRAEHDVAE